MAQLKELRIDYAVSMKAHVGNFETHDARVGRSETWDVSGMTAEEADAFYDKRYEEIQADSAEKVVAKYNDIHRGEI